MEEQLVKLRVVDANTPKVRVWHLQRDYATLSILAISMKDVIMSWLGCRVVPHSPCEYQRLEGSFKELLFWRINAE